MTNGQLLRLFHFYNRRFFKSGLPTYQILVSTLHNGGYHDRATRTIFLNPIFAADGRNARATLLHEMAHASTNDAHGFKWRCEMLRLAKLGAPIDKVDLAPRKDWFSVGDLLAECEDTGFQLPGAEWKSLRQGIGYRNGLLDERGKTSDRRCAVILRKARLAFLKGLRQRVYLDECKAKRRAKR